MILPHTHRNEQETLIGESLRSWELLSQ
jgi:hypothetical protein